MKISQLVSEATRTAVAQRVASCMTVILAAAMCASTLLTVGRSAAGEQQVQERLESAGSRRLVVEDRKADGFMTASTVTVLSRLDSVERVVGLTDAIDVTNTLLGPGGDKVPARGLIGAPSDAVTLVQGRWPRAGEALAGASALRTLGFTQPFGSVQRPDGSTVPVVGTFTARAPYDELDAGIVIMAPPAQAAQVIDVVIARSTAAAVTERAVLATLNRSDPSDLTVRSAATLADVQAAVLGDLTDLGRRLMLLVLGVGGFLVAVVALSDVLLHRRDLGRRRALGAPRWVLVSLVVTRTSMAAMVGAALGTVVGLGYTAASEQPVPIGFGVGTAVLTILTATLAALPPAVAAALRDPVRVLRTP